MKKAQLSFEPFVYILIIVVIALMFLFGFKLIKNFTQEKELINYNAFKLGLDRQVKSISLSNKGTTYVFSKDSRLSPLYVPKNVEYVCFKTNNYNPSLVKDIPDNEILIANKNVFLLPLNKDYNSFDLDVKPVPDPLCLKIKNNQLFFTLENKGDYVEIRE